MKCVKCRGTAAIEIRRHNCAFCAEHFLEYFDNQVRKAISDWRMFEPEERILVAVSGGKDSLALWDVLLHQGYRADGFHMDLGIGEYSQRSQQKASAFAESRGACLELLSLSEETRGLIGSVTELARRTRRAPCSACGLTKRYNFNRLAADLGYHVLATGHNLDDEAAALLGNVLHWQEGYLGRQSPAMPSTSPRLIKRVKPLYRLSERETAAYAVLRGIDYLVEECPNAGGNTGLLYKDALNALEHAAPGTKHAFLYGFLERIRPRFAEEGLTLKECALCGEPTTAEVCAHCRMLQRAGVELVPLAVPE